MVDSVEDTVGGLLVRVGDLGVEVEQNGGRDNLLCHLDTTVETGV